MKYKSESEKGISGI